MKTITLLLVTFSLYLFSYSNVLSQTKKYNTKIETANKVEIKAGNAEIKNAQNITIGTIIIAANVKPRYYFNSFSRHQDSTGSYITVLEFIHDGQPENIYIDFRVDVNTPFTSVRTIYNGVGMSEFETVSNDNKWYSYKSFVQTIEKKIWVQIISKQPVFVKLTGVDAKP